MTPEHLPALAPSGAVSAAGHDGGAGIWSEGAESRSCGRGRFGFSRRCRLICSIAFAQAFEGDRQWPTRTLVLWVRRAPDAACRAGVVAGKRTFRLAVERNRARRLLREAFRLNRERIAPGVDVVLLARRRILDVKRPAVELDLLRACRQAGILREEAARCSDV